MNTCSTSSSGQAAATVSINSQGSHNNPVEARRAYAGQQEARTPAAPVAAATQGMNSRASRKDVLQCPKASRRRSAGSMNTCSAIAVYRQQQQ
jgi:hypothetical protein